jgi:hypothetical protein
MELVSLVKMCLNEAYSKVPIGKHLSASFPLYCEGMGYLSVAGICLLTVS